jgi:hypothetical protein
LVSWLLDQIETGQLLKLPTPVTDTVPPTLAPAGLKRVISGFSSPKERVRGENKLRSKQLHRRKKVNLKVIGEK